jgi:hypothetical protein
VADGCSGLVFDSPLVLLEAVGVVVVLRVRLWSAGSGAVAPFPVLRCFSLTGRCDTGVGAGPGITWWCGFGALGALDSQEGQGEHRAGHVPVPGGPFADPVLAESGELFALFVVLFNLPPGLIISVAGVAGVAVGAWAKK